MINCHLIMLYVLCKQLSSHLITGTSCAFLLTKSSDLPLYYFLLSPYVHLCCYKYSGYREASGYVGEFNLGGA
jgi:hypothetical protein